MQHFRGREAAGFVGERRLLRLYKAAVLGVGGMSSIMLFAGTHFAPWLKVTILGLQVRVVGWKGWD
jgi:hypothetical protein